MGYSVTGIMSSSMYGLPLAGVDICGFTFDTTPELCTRWTVLGTFYPFSRNHNAYGWIPQEPYREMFQVEYEPGVTYASILKDAIRRKYTILRYLYTNMMKISAEGGQIYKPVFYEFPEDPMAYKEPALNYMIGEALKASMLSTKTGVNETDFYFPAGTWCDLYTENCFLSNGESLKLRTKAYDYHIHLREGFIVPF